ncbi:uncharacterized protein LOC127873753 [Dreissena polymorpha]|uniref:NAD-dependent epimerase/dehydratase domain-containing protein n=1 Tax=Dreissena polymorpha TaxID=45954 RepID=A0A9D4LI13_DREPO|nr:uncharacterized protein LOC127873753 [Dreissena polymorpha]KAH3858144.1 hypothetical protein DPMN_100764 [Dreissena polymorpha]
MTFSIWIMLFHWIFRAESVPNVQYDILSRKTVLIFGGNGLLGSATTERLLRSNFNIVLINRGNWYWDTADTIKPFVRHLKCDRMQSLQRCSGLQHYIWSLDAPPMFDAVIDFSAYHPFEITESLTLLQGKIKRYIYISSDSVYEVCNKTHTGLTREEDAVRPKEDKEREQYILKDDYGNRKLQCEETLRSQVDDVTGVPFVALRLPDVVGARDNTHRWWIYQLWVKLSEYIDKPLSVPQHLWNRPMSLVYANDVAEVIANVITMGPQVNDEAFNLAFNEMPTLVNFLHSIMDALNLDDIDIHVDESVEAFHLFPSVRLGPIDTSKSKKLLNWNPTSWHDVLYETVAFYEDAVRNVTFHSARNDVIRIIQQHLTRDPAKVVRGLWNEYKVMLGGKHDEL